MLSVVMLSVIMLSVVMLNVVMLSVIMVNVVYAFFCECSPKQPPLRVEHLRVSGDSLENVRLGWKISQRTNTLAYFQLRVILIIYTLGPML